MSKISALITLTVLFLTPALAPAVNQSAWGVRGGWSTADVGGDPIGESLQALTGGMTFNWDLGWAVQLRIEALYSRKGGEKIVVGVGHGCGLTDILLLANARLDYLEFPLLAKWHPGQGPTYFSAGPFLGVLIADEVESCQEYDCLEAPFICAGEEEFLCEWQPTFGLLSDVDSGVVVGLGHEFQVGGLDASLDLRYHHGLKDINRFKGYVLRTRLISVTAGVTLF